MDGGDPAFLQLIEAEHGRILETRAYNTHLLIDDMSALFPTRMLRYRNGNPFANRILAACDFTTTETGLFIRALSRSHGVPSLTYDLFCALLVTCIGCMNHFTVDAYNAHLLDLPTKTTCRNNPDHPEVQRFDVAVPRETLPGRQFPPGRAPGQIHAAPFAEFTYTAVGIALLALNTQFGLPDDIWRAVRSTIVPCSNCCFMRTIHGHVHHAPNSKCNDVGTQHPSIILTGGGMGKVRANKSDDFKPVVVHDDDD
ncbi:hypothetical protein B0H19DRAFT_1150255 [Mycena capillaripes]|nr:hypothetical protein B0H19DRAFT_1150255 [Mycena capillaripes]